MNHTRRLGRLGGLVAVAVAAAPFAYLWVQMMIDADDPLSFRVRLDIAIWMAVFGMPAMLAAWLLWRVWWRRAGARLSGLDGPGWLLAGATATLPADRRDWGAAMTAELAQVPDGPGRWRFAVGCARAAVFPAGGSRVAVGGVGALALVAIVAVALVTGAVLAVARSRRVGQAGPGLAITATALAGVAGCLGFTIWYLAEHPFYDRAHPAAVVVGLPPGTAVVLAVVLAGCLWLALAPPRWLVPDRLARRFGVAMAIALVAGFVLVSRLEQRDMTLDAGIMSYMLAGPILVVLGGSVAAAAAGRSFRAGLWASAWAVVLGAPLLIGAWLAEALPWYRQGRGLLLDGEGGLGVGANLGNAVWWTLVLLVLWALPLGVIGAAAGSAGTRRRRAGEHDGLASAS